MAFMKYNWRAFPAGACVAYKASTAVEFVKMGANLTTAKHYYAPRGVTVEIKPDEAALSYDVRIVANTNKAPTKPKSSSKPPVTSRIERARRSFYRDAFIALLPTYPEGDAHNAALDASNRYKGQLEAWAAADQEKNSGT